MDSSPRSSHILRYGHITCAHWEEERKNLSDTVTIQYSDQSGTANFAPLQKPHRYRPIQYVVRVGARANITLVSMLIDVTAVLIWHFHLYSQVEGGRLDRKYAGLHNRLYFFAFFRPAKASAKRAMEERQTRASSPSSIAILLQEIVAFCSAIIYTKLWKISFAIWGTLFAQ